MQLRLLLCSLLLVAPSMALLAPRYFARLELDPALLDVNPTWKKLAAIQEAHLRHIPFENMAQHGAPGGPAVLETAATAEKILDRKRGGFCYEVNMLLADFLTELGYGVARVPATVFAGDAFLPLASHIILAVSCEDTAALQYVDVGFGEPPLHPLHLEDFGQEQTTPEGMCSKLTLEGEDDIVVWWKLCGKWSQRLRWSYKTCREGLDSDSEPFKIGLAAVQQDDSVFAEKLVVSKLTEETKTTLAGSRLKITGPPRFSEEEIIPVIRELESEDEARQVLLDVFGIPLVESDGLDLGRSKATGTNIWDAL